MNAIRDQFLLDPTVTFLNHGSFGATPKVVFEEYQYWQRDLERQPVDFFRRKARLLREARVPLAEYLGTSPDQLGFVFNTSFGVNAIVHSLAQQLGPDDEVLSTNHEYGAVDKTWDYYAKRAPFKHIKAEIDVPVTSPEAFVEQFWRGVTRYTRVISLSHITSGTALQFPVEQVVARARSEGIFTVIDGAHAPGQIPLNLDALGADVYIGNCHKWLCAPKGSAFVHANERALRRIDPVLVSWGWFETERSATPLHDYLEMQGTRDIASFLSVPAAIRFQATHNWPARRDACHELVRNARAQMQALTGIAQHSPDERRWFTQLSILRLPAGTDVVKLKESLWKDHKIEIPAINWNNLPGVRISIQAYNDQSDVDKLIGAVAQMI